MTITQEQIDRQAWFHEFEFANGMKATTAHNDQKAFYASRQAFLTGCVRDMDFAGKAVVDVGCWDGYYSFIAEKMGASSVLAVDDYSQNWGSKECFAIAKELNRSGVQLSDTSVYDIHESLRGRKFDVVLFLGVFYHLHAPYLAFSRLRELCHESTVVAIEGACIRDRMRSYAEITLDNPSKEKFLPSIKLLKDMLKSCYFEVESEHLLSELGGAALAERLSEDDLFEVLRKNVKLEGAKQPTKPSEAAAVLDRIFLTAKPFAGENASHFYQPPFGLKNFDSGNRFL